METKFDFAAILIDPVLLAIAVIYVYGFIARISPNPTLRNICMGATFGLGALFAMLTPIEFADGVIIDMRNLLVGLSGAFFGVLGSAIAITIAITTRIYLGGGGAAAGCLGIILAGLAGLIWARFFRNRLKNRTAENVILGAIVSMHLFAMAILPAEIRWHLLLEIAPILVVFNLLGSILIGSLLEREESLIAENEALFDAATTDPLTRLHNRRSAVSAYENLPHSKVTNHGTAMLCIDVDNFKSVNDSYGHPFGDAILSQISDRVSQTLRPTDIFSRLGGDEFLIILPSVTHEETMAIAERCRAVIATEAMSHEDNSAPVTISIGAEWRPDRPDFLTFVAKADGALYQAKRLGRNCVALAWQNASLAAQAMSDQSKHSIV